ncbi:hypothetical protein K0M31_020151 [Melipona bicolor]|uniref:Uncharacterized protein n=1 Tax=Melipona bicolor TaxID=60889 RepID=A0AA40G1Z7_9HYME|nr:hypothetical protein K0M31_020151 [Melipona bicolor]
MNGAQFAAVGTAGFSENCADSSVVERLDGLSEEFVRNESVGDRYTSGLACVRESITSQLTGENKNGCDAVSKD